MRLQRHQLIATGGCVLAVLLAAWTGYRFFSPPPPAITPISEASAPSTDGGRTVTQQTPAKPPVLGVLSRKLAPTRDPWALARQAGAARLVAWLDRWAGYRTKGSPLPDRGWDELSDIVRDENLSFELLDVLGCTIRFVESPARANIAFRASLDAAERELKTLKPGSPGAIAVADRLGEIRYSLWEEKDHAAIVRLSKLELTCGRSEGRPEYLAMHFVASSLVLDRKPQEAMVVSERILSQYSGSSLLLPIDHGETYWLHGYILIRLGRYEDAIPFLQQAATIPGEHQKFALMALPWCLAQAGDIEGARRAWKQALRQTDMTDDEAIEIALAIEEVSKSNLRYP